MGIKNKIAFFVLRFGIGLVFLIFGIGKLQNDYWARTMATMSFFKGLPWPVGVSVNAVGVIEIAVGVGLMAGVLRRACAVVAACMLTGILVLFEFQEIRDIGLLAAAVYMSLVHDDSWGIDWFFCNKKRKTI